MLRYTATHCCVSKIALSALVNNLAEAATTNRVPDDHARQSEYTARETSKVYFHAHNSCLLLAHSNFLISSILYSLLLLLLHSPYVLAHTTPLFQVIYRDMLCTRNLPNTVLLFSLKPKTRSSNSHLIHKNSRNPVPYPIRWKGKRKSYPLPS